MTDSRNLFVADVPNIGVDVHKLSKYTPSSINQPQVVDCQVVRLVGWLRTGNHSKTCEGDIQNDQE